MALSPRESAAKRAQRVRTRLKSLANGVAAAMKIGTRRDAIDVSAWAATYPGVSETDVREAWAIALAKVAPNTDQIVEGK